MAVAKCVACGERVDSGIAHPELIAKNEIKFQVLKRTHCFDCALELATGHVYQHGAETMERGTGGGERVIRDSKTMS